MGLDAIAKWFGDRWTGWQMAREARGLVPDYVEDSRTDGLDVRDCQEHSSLSGDQCNLLASAIQDGFTLEEREKMIQSGIHPAFIRELAGDDGLKALRRRAQWLADHVKFRWTIDSDGYHLWRRGSYIGELEKLPPAVLREVVPTLLEVAEEEGREDWDNIHSGDPSSMVLSLVEKSGDPALLEKLQSIDEKQLDPEARLRWLVMMGKRGDVRGEEGFLAILEKRKNGKVSVDDENFLNAIEGAGLIREKRAVPFLIQILEEDIYNARESLSAAKAVEALYRIGDPGSAATLMKLVVKTYYSDLTDATALKTVGEIGGDEAVRLLTEFVFSHSSIHFYGSDERIFQAAADALALTGDPRAVLLARRWKQDIVYFLASDDATHLQPSYLNGLSDRLSLLDETIDHLLAVNPDCDEAAEFEIPPGEF